MKRFSFGLTATILVTMLSSATTWGSPAAPETTCTFERRIGYDAQIVPERACAGQPLALLITSCAECDRIVAGFALDSAQVALRFDSRPMCPRLLPCLPASVLIPLDGYAAGPHALALHIV